MPMFVAFVLGIALMVIFLQRKAYAIYKEDLAKVTRIKGLLAERINKHFASNPTIWVTELDLICARTSLEEDVDITVTKNKDMYVVAVKQGRAVNRIRLTGSVVQENRMVKNK